MYCRKCGHGIKDINTPCPYCGNLPLDGQEYCQECGFPSQPGQAICVSCQGKLIFAQKKATFSEQVKDQSQEPNPNSTLPEFIYQDEDIPNDVANIAACCSLPFTAGLPIVGLILYLVWKDEKPNAAKSVCLWSIIPFIVILVLAFILGFTSNFFYHI